MEVPVGLVPTSSRIQTNIVALVLDNCEYCHKLHTIRSDQRTERIEKPPMTVQLLLILFFQAKDNLNRTCALGDFALIGDHYM